MKFSINHIALSVKNVDTSIEFYKSVFGLQEIENTASNYKTRWLTFNDDRQIHLIPRPKAEIKINKAVHFAFSTESVEEFVSHLNNLEINFTDWKDNPQTIFVRNDGIKQVYVQDPDGYWIKVNNDI